MAARAARLTPAERRALLYAGNEADAGELDGWANKDIRALRSAIRKLRGDPADPAATSAPNNEDNDDDADER